MKNLYLFSFIFLLLKSSVFSRAPHIIFMFIDDLGWNDVSFHGSLQIPTPNIDVLAMNGVILNNYYVQPLCTPSRGSLMTGKYPIKLGLQHYVISAAEPWGLSTEEKLLPQYLKEIGYKTHCVGKWHLGHHTRKYLPTNRGFDSFFGFYNGKEDHFTHFETEEHFSGLDFHDGENNSWENVGKYGTDVFTEKAKRLIKSHNASEPLFLYLSHQAVHAGNSYSPLQAPLKYVNKFSSVKDEKRRVFAGMVSALDHSVEEIVLALNDSDLLENSIIIFSTDNGAAVRGIDDSSGSNWPLRGSKYNMWEGGVRGTAFVWSRLLPRSKRVSQDLMHISDWLPTLYAAAGGNINDLKNLDGYNLWPTISRSENSPRKEILLNIDEIWKVEGIRKNQYKLLKGSVFGGEFDGWFDKEGKKEINKAFRDELDPQRKMYLEFLVNSKAVPIIMGKSKQGSDFKWNSEDHGYCYSENDKDNYCVLNESFFSEFFAPIEVDCGSRSKNASANCHPLKSACLFDIEKDPCEYNNIYESLPLVVQDLESTLNRYRAEAVSPRNKPIDPKANPKDHGYAWVPWLKEKS